MIATALAPQIATATACCAMSPASSWALLLGVLAVPVLGAVLAVHLGAARARRGRTSAQVDRVRRLSVAAAREARAHADALAAEAERIGRWL